MPITSFVTKGDLAFKRCIGALDGLASDLAVFSIVLCLYLNDGIKFDSYTISVLPKLGVLLTKLLFAPLVVESR